ncbi:hypothetical protein WH50_22620 [Pokkaliibacter plantistimulans]|uniref:HTH lysR-type domain-containing protein n=2 Tax=Pokkaliibacter plantistimulans TaxID=1635171 RepID=A0ABX5LSH1_9GAMM|nr:hypothetical protein WH50_22620 [Pokkaliibacter plantistimulans]
MRMDKFDLNLLIVLDVLLEEKNVTRASERLHIGQSATSAALSRLRDHFEDSLLVPVGRRMELTPLARSLINPVRDALMKVRATVALRPCFDPATVNRSYTIAASDYMVSVLISKVVREIANIAPGMHLNLTRVPDDILGQFEKGDIDILVIPEQYAKRIQHPQIDLMHDEHICMMCAEHAISINELSMDDYMSSGHVAIRIGEEGSIAFEEWFLPRYGRQRRIECTVDHFSAAPFLVMGTDRIVTLHYRLAIEMAKHYPVKLLPAPFEMPSLTEVMVWPCYQDEDPAHKWLRERLLSIACAITH